MDAVVRNRSSFSGTPINGIHKRSGRGGEGIRICGGGSWLNCLVLLGQGLGGPSN